MAYFSLKIFHILAAGIFCSSIVWYFSKRLTSAETSSLQLPLWGIILPCALLLLVSGFTIISMMHYMLTTLWVKIAVFGVMGLAVCAIIDALTPERVYNKHPWLEKALMLIFLSILSAMVYGMSNLSS
ncbi:MAG: hypothetical protein CMF50_04325 [Legionellales bacterium]|nr:hypothetical protein [Legionellales bacterium]|tara:strand:+ start:20657 stop:21040 length:384 start_codon:yes stop_codon:yes gene_type:complete